MHSYFQKETRNRVWDDDREDPILIIKWDEVGLAQRAAAVPAGTAADPGATMRSTHTYNALTKFFDPTPRPAFNQTSTLNVSVHSYQAYTIYLAIERVRTKNGTIGVNKGTAGITIIIFDSIPILEARLYDLMVNQCQVLVSDSTLAKDSGQIFRGYAYRSGVRYLAEIETLCLAYLSM